MKAKKKKWPLIAAGILVLVAAAAIIMHDTVWIVWANLTQPKIQLTEGTEWAGGTFTRVSYGKESSQYLDLYVPSGTENKPLFVLIHGGGFVAGDTQTRQTQFMYRYFRDHGFACASVNYRLAEEAKYPAAIEDVRDAVRFLAAHAGEYGYTADRIAIWGESAGGYLAAYEAVTEDQVNIAALVDYYGVMDFPSMTPQFREQGIPSLVVRIGNSWVSSTCKGYDSFEECWIGQEKSGWTDELKSRISVLSVIRAGTANQQLNAMILHGDADITVPYAQSTAVAQELSDAYGAEHVSFQLLHGFGHASDRFYTDERLNEVAEFLHTALDTQK